MKNYIFWSEIGSGFEEPGGTPPPPLPGGGGLKRGVASEFQNNGTVLIFWTDNVFCRLLLRIARMDMD